MIKPTLLALCLLATSAGAETEIDAWGLGHHKARPTATRTVEGLYSLRARLVDAKTGDPAEVVLAGHKLRLELAFTAENGNPNDQMRLRCRVQFLDAEATASEFSKEAICFDGKVADGAGGFAAMNLPLTFRPSPADPAGTSAVKVRVTDEATGEDYLLVPTYDWRGGRGPGG